MWAYFHGPDYTGKLVKETVIDSTVANEYIATSRLFFNLYVNTGRVGIEIPTIVMSEKKLLVYTWQKEASTNMNLFTGSPYNMFAHRNQVS